MASDTTPKDSQATRRLPKFGAFWIVVACAVLSCLFISIACNSDATLGSIYWGLFAAHGFVCLVCVLIGNPVVVERRMKSGPGTKAWDKVWIALILVNSIAVCVVATYDLKTRAGESTRPGTPLWLLGAVIFGFGWTILTWSMLANPFFEKTVRIQTEHGHHVVNTGPYAYIRHPGYVGFCALLLSTPLLIASVWTSSQSRLPRSGW